MVNKKPGDERRESLSILQDLSTSYGHDKYKDIFLLLVICFDIFSF